MLLAAKGAEATIQERTTYAVEVEEGRPWAPGGADAIPGFCERHIKINDAKELQTAPHAARASTAKWTCWGNVAETTSSEKVPTSS